jgi:hypothetical protein
MKSRFFFHLSKGEQRLIDRMGFELTEEMALSRAVLKIIVGRWARMTDVSLWQGWSVEIVDAAGRTVQIIALDELGGS